MNDRPRREYTCETHVRRYMDNRGDWKEVKVVGCGATFTTCGKPRECPRCHAHLGDGKR